ncbi:hypothetical protein AGMMS49949_06420 [Alphaproteobacteria bacterium]|nr:hypothetical protein AGMMS49949_06420 [Alphaproteobacteria bacterium]
MTSKKVLLASVASVGLVANFVSGVCAIRIGIENQGTANDLAGKPESQELLKEKPATKLAILAFPTPIDSYEGSVDENSLPHGKGMVRYDDGTIWEGDWVHGVREGKGIETRGDGSKYEGGYVNNCREGEGTWTGHGEQYVGSFKAGKREGRGTST